VIMKTLFALLILAIGVSAQASEYPADSNIKYSCQTQRAVRVCRSMQSMYGLAALDISYSGDLAGSPGVSAVVRVNYLDGVRQLTVPLERAYRTSVARITGGCLVGTLGGCAKRGTAEMRDLLVWAQQSGGKLNALDVEVSFVDQYGHWDNNGRPYGSYRFLFPEE
jgi:hypothetical protein